MAEKRMPVNLDQINGPHARRPQYEPTDADRNTVRSMAATGFTHEAIARCLGTDGIDPKTLRLHFRQELDTASPMANAKIANVAYQRAVAGEPWAVCFWLKCRAGWKETNRNEITGADGAPLEVNSGIELLTARIDSLIARSAADEPTGQPE